MSELRPNSRFRPFSANLPNGGKVTGITCIPDQTPTTPNCLPLIVGVHGGGGTCQYFDADEDHTSSLAAVALGIPFVSVNRPCYSDSSSLLPLAENQTFYQESGRWMHEQVFPVLWKTFGQPNACVGIVTLNHSMAVPIAIVTASLHSLDTAQKYPLAGLILTGFGTNPKLQKELAELPITKETTRVLYPQQTWKKLMLAEDHLQCHDPKITTRLFDTRTSITIEELVDLRSQWSTYWQQYVSTVKTPIMYAIGQHDWLWETTPQTVEQFAASFLQSSRVDTSIVEGAPHAIEWSRMSKSFYTRCFGWAGEVCSSQQKSD